VAGKDTQTVVSALIKQAKKLPKELDKSLTWDRGEELTDHRRFTLATTDHETQARNQLQTEWLQFSPRAKAQCRGETGADGTSSYVEFLTCLEMERDMKIEGEANKTSK
jgi:hypothetical protein